MELIVGEKKSEMKNGSQKERKKESRLKSTDSVVRTSLRCAYAISFRN